MEKDKICAYIIHEAITQSNMSNVRRSTNGSIIFEANLQDAGVWNRNKRNYTKSAIDDGLRGEKVQELIARKQWFGENDHPSGAALERQSKIDKNNITHRINRYWWEGNMLKGEVETLNNIKGGEMRNLIFQGVEPAFSLRAVGPVKATPQGQLVEGPLGIICYDWVTIPSHKTAYMTKILDDGRGSRAQDRLQEAYNGVTIPILTEEVQKFLNESSGDCMLTESYLSNLTNLGVNDIVLNESFDEHGFGKRTRLIINEGKNFSDEMNDYFLHF